MSSETTARAKLAAHKSWARTRDRTARTHRARMALEDKFLQEAEGDPKRAENIRQAYYRELAHKSAAARRRRSGDLPSAFNQ